MILSAQSIRKRKIILPFEERALAHGMTYGLGPAGYDVRIAESFWISPGEAKLASTIEHFHMPDDVLGRVHDKSTWARRFLAVQNTVIEPGWRGHLTLELSNHGVTSLKIEEGMPIAQIIFELLDEPTERPYAGKYQDQKAGAVAPIYEHAAIVGTATYTGEEPGYDMEKFVEPQQELHRAE
jgi:dCTP deaminase